MVDGAEGEIDSPTVFSQSVTAFAASGADTGAAEVSNSTDADAPERGATIAVIRGSPALSFSLKQRGHTSVWMIVTPSTSNGAE